MVGGVLRLPARREARTGASGVRSDRVGTGGRKSGSSVRRAVGVLPHRISTAGPVTDGSRRRADAPSDTIRAAVAPDLAELVDPSHTALVTQECQNGVIGERAIFPALADVARAEMIPNAARLAKAARAGGVPVVHCLALRRDDGLGSNDNAKVFAAARKSGVALEPG